MQAVRIVVLFLLAALAGEALAAPREDPGAADKLASLNRAIEPLSDIDQIIQRYERFAAANPGTVAAEEATASAALWRDRKSRGMTKVGGKWMTPAERDEIVASIDPKIQNAQELLAAGQQRDAEAVLTEVLQLNARHLAALYLTGVIQYGQEKLPAARKSFEAVNSQISGHAPTLNNLAAINFRQKQIGAAMSLFEQAMLAAPLDRTIIDNVAEALNTLQENDQRLPVITRVGKLFAEQEAALALKLKEQDLYRWGAGWVDKAQYDKLIALDKGIQEKVQQYKIDFDLLTSQIQSLESQIEASDREMKRIRDQSYYIDRDGRIIQMRLPSHYYDEQRRMDTLKSDRLRAISQQKALREQAKRVHQDFPVPKFTGALKMIGVEGTPIEAKSDLPPTTQPAK